MSNYIVVLTAEKQAGKTTFLTLWSKGKKEVDGILTPVIDGRRHFYNIMDGSDFSMEAPKEDGNTLVVGNYSFSSQAFEKASALLLEKSKNPLVTTLILDEIGPLEIEQKKGFYDVFCELLREQRQQTILIVVRPSLVEKVSALLKSYDKQVKVIHLNDIQATQA